MSSSLEEDTVATNAAKMLKCSLCGSSNQKTRSEHEGKSLKTCQNCGVSFLTPQPSPSAIATYFQDSSALDEDGLRSKFESNREKVLSRVATYIRNRKHGGRILDVGCATGFFLHRFFGDPDWQAWGVELSTWEAAKAAQRGIRVHLGNIHSAKLSANSFDVITVLDAFYYFPDPQAQLTEFCRVLKPDGVLVLEIPLAGSRIWRTSRRLGRILSGAKLPLLQTSDHLFYYTHRSISFLLTRCGFKVEAALPLPGNQQGKVRRTVIYAGYSFVSSVLHNVSRGRIILGPRLLVAAVKDSVAGTAAIRTLTTVDEITPGRQIQLRSSLPLAATNESKG